MMQDQLSGDERTAAELLGWNESNWEITAVERIRMVAREWAALKPDEQAAVSGVFCVHTMYLHIIT